VHTDARATGGTLDLAIPVPSEEPYWLYLRTLRIGESDEWTVGPYAAGETRYTVHVPYIEGLKLDASPSNARTVPSPPAIDPSTLGALRFAVIDARTQGGISGARITTICDPDGKSQLRAREWLSDERGDANLEELAAGRWTLHVSAPGYASTATAAMLVPEGGVAEVSPIALEAERVH
jgi:hypothetical protein